jgi:hypothetical protein
MHREFEGIGNGSEHESILPCMQPCRKTAVQAGREQTIQVPVRPGRCPFGFSRLQIGILSLVKSNPGVLAYWQFAEILSNAWSLEITESAVRGAINRMPRHAFLLRSRARTLSHSGNLYTLSADPCLHITPLTEYVRFPVQAVDHAAGCDASSSRQIEKENLSISGDHATSRLLALSESDYALHWPKLAQAGVGVALIEQALEALRKVGKSTEKIFEALSHAEWELEHEVMLDKEGRQVVDPASWIFRALATNGSYRRPKGYVSPEEQALLDAIAEANRRKAALEQLAAREFEVWRESLSPETLENFLPNRKPSEPSIRYALLRTAFRERVWPEILAALPMRPDALSSDALRYGIGPDGAASHAQEVEDGRDDA